MGFLVLQFLIRLDQWCFSYWGVTSYLTTWQLKNTTTLLSLMILWVDWGHLGSGLLHLMSAVVAVPWGLNSAGTSEMAFSCLASWSGWLEVWTEQE